MYIRQNTSPLPVTLTRVPAPQRLTASTHWRPISPCRAGQIMFVCLLSLLLGCGRIAVYSDNALQQEAGIKFYTPKPYLLVSRTGAKEKPIEVKLIYLPDVSVPYYAKLKPGMGSANLSLTFENGSLKTVGQNTDPQIDELVTALGSFATSAREAIAPPPTTKSNKLPALSHQLEKRVQDLDSILKSQKDGTPLVELNKPLTDLRGNLESIIKEIKEELAPKAEIELKAAFKLYEIRMKETKGTTKITLHEVKMR